MRMKFQVGDTVEVHRDVVFSGVKIGDKGVVVKIDGEYHIQFPQHSSLQVCSVEGTQAGYLSKVVFSTYEKIKASIQGLKDNCSLLDVDNILAEIKTHHTIAIDQDEYDSIDDIHGEVIIRPKRSYALGMRFKYTTQCEKFIAVKGALLHLLDNSEIKKEVPVKLEELFFHNKWWYVDTKLEQLRDVNNPHNVIPFTDIERLSFTVRDAVNQ